MASYRVLPPIQRPKNDFFKSFGKGFGSGITDTLKERKEKRESEEKKSKFAKAMELGGMEISGTTQDEKGNVSYRYSKKKDKKDDLTTPKAFQRAALGLGDVEGVAKVLGVPRQIYQAKEPQGYAMTPQGPKGIVSKKHSPNYYAEAVRERVAPGMDVGAIVKDYVGLPQEKVPKKTVPPEFSNDIMKLKAEAAKADKDPETEVQGMDIFVAGLQAIGMKYIDNPLVLQRIKLILQALDE